MDLKNSIFSSRGLFNWNERDNKKSFFDLGNVIKLNLVYIIIFAFMGLVLSFYYYKTIEPVYIVKSKILIKENDVSVSRLKSINDYDGYSGLSMINNVENELEIISTYSIVEEVVNNLGLNIVIKNKQFLNNFSVYANSWEIKILNYTPNIFDNSTKHSYRIFKNNNHTWIEANNTKWSFEVGKPLVLPIGKVLINNKNRNVRDGEWELVISKPSTIVQYYIDKIKSGVSNKNSSIISLSITTPNPIRDKIFLDNLLQTYIKRGISDNNYINDNILLFINDRINDVSIDLLSVEKEIEKFKQENQFVNSPEQIKMFLDLTRSNTQQLVDAQIRYNIINSIENELKRSRNAIIPSGIVVNDSSLTSLIENYNNTVLHRENLSKSATPENPALKNIDSRLDIVRHEILQNILSSKNQLRIVLDQLDKGNIINTTNINNIPTKERLFLEMSRQQMIKQELYLFLLKKKEETAIGGASKISNIRIIDPARIIDEPIGPNLMIYLILGLVLGISFPLLIAIIKNRFNTKILTKKELTEINEIPIVGELFNRKDFEFFEVDKIPVGGATEQFWKLRSNLFFYENKDLSNVFLITSSVSGEGKTYVSFNLATILSKSKKESKILIIDLDLRQPKLTKQLKLKGRKGFSDYIIGKCSINDIINSVPDYSNLYAIPSGIMSPNPSELLMSSKASSLFVELREIFDFIIIDSPPVLVADYLILSRFSDITLALIKMNYTEKVHIEYLNEIYRSGKLPKMSLIVNGINPDRYFESYSKYGNYK